MITLSDGRRVEVRQLDATDADALVTAFEAADPGDLRRRFMGGPPPARFLVQRLKEADGIHHLALGAFDDEGVLVGVAQFDRNDDQPTAEIAIEVATDWQHDRLGTSMLAELAIVARDLGIRRLSARFLTDNRPIRNLLEELGALLSVRYEGGEGFVDIDLDGIVPATAP